LGTLGLHDRGGRFASGAATALLPPVAAVAIAYDNRALHQSNHLFFSWFRTRIRHSMAFAQPF
jgi:hypothetical protein